MQDTMERPCLNLWGCWPHSAVAMLSHPVRIWLYMYHVGNHQKNALCMQAYELNS